jgi:hypothetical protein
MGGCRPSPRRQRAIPLTSAAHDPAGPARFLRDHRHICSSELGGRLILSGLHGCHDPVVRGCHQGCGDLRFRRRVRPRADHHHHRQPVGPQWQLRLNSPVACLCAFAYARAIDGRRSAWVLASVASVGLTIALTLTGHAAGVARRMAIHRRSSVEWWCLARHTRQLRGDPAQAVGRTSHCPVSSVSRVAVTGTAVLLATGTLSGRLYVGS